MLANVYRALHQAAGFWEAETTHAYCEVLRKGTHNEVVHRRFRLGAKAKAIIVHDRSLIRAPVV